MHVSVREEAAPVFRLFSWSTAKVQVLLRAVSALSREVRRASTGRPDAPCRESVSSVLVARLEGDEADYVYQFKSVLKS